MLIQLYPFLDPSHINAGLIGRLRALADDAAHLHSGAARLARLLQTAPLLEYWVPVQRPEGVRLIGQVEDRMIITSPLWFADPDGSLDPHPVALLPARPACEPWRSQPDLVLDD